LPVIQRAREVLKLLEEEQLSEMGRRGLGAGVENGVSGGGGRRAARDIEQLALFTPLPHPVVERLKAVDVNSMTPLEALTLLATLARDAQQT
jgi:DNA mismatch repair protein MutS